MIKAVYPAKEAASLAGFETVAMLDYVERQGLFTSETGRSRKRGRRRFYTFRDLVMLRTIGTLLENGASVLALKRALHEFQKSNIRIEPAVLSTAGGGALRFFVISAGSVYLKASVDELVDVARNGQLAFSFMIDLEAIHKRLREDPRIRAKHFKAA